ncbi:MAG: DNA-binding protein [Planctomycetaceae bacterium]|nr:MAG: DNA-binding protein [Planctomycetaceae bacterium]
MAETKAGKALSKSEVLTQVAEKTGIARKQVAEVLDALAQLIQSQLSKKGPGVFQLPGLMKITVVRKPATKATKRPNPFKPGEMMEVKAKPARNVVKIRPLKQLKEMVN